jgi:hypothetical protein
MRSLPDCYKFIRAIVHRNPWDEDVEIMLALYENGKPVSTCKTLEFEPLPEGARLNPTFRLFGHEAQELMDMLWECGIRPTQGKQSVGQLEATERHLADMRRLVFEETP